MCAQSAVMAFEVENTLTIVSRSHGRVRAASACPPQRSTTRLPPTMAANEAPTSRPAAKFAANASRTAPKRDRHSPWIVAAIAMPGPVAEASAAVQGRADGAHAGRGDPLLGQVAVESSPIAPALLTIRALLLHVLMETLDVLAQ